MRAIIETLVDAATAPLYAVGGTVRDLILHRDIHTRDVDIAVDGDAVELARSVAATLGVPITIHERFGTATLGAGLVHVDVAMTRSEGYPSPAHLPVVSPAGIEADLGRRDFSINAMAIPLAGSGELLDPHGGRSDCRRQTVRALHERSFIDDPTRAFRAVRYAGRLGFSLDPDTVRWLVRDTRYVDRLSPARLRREVLLILQEERPSAALGVADDLGLLAKLDPALAFTAITAAVIDRPVEPSTRDSVPVRLAILALDLAPAANRRFRERLALPRALYAVVEAIPATLLAVRSISGPRTRPSDVVATLEGRPIPVLQAIAATTAAPALRVQINAYFDNWARLRPSTPASALAARGLAGPKLGEWLRRLRDARLDGETDAAGEVAWLDDHLD